MMLLFLDSMSEPSIDDALVETDDTEEESENQPDFFLLLLLDSDEDVERAEDPLEDAWLCRCCSAIWSSPIAR